jgi:hypothetical protein
LLPRNLPATLCFSGVSPVIFPKGISTLDFADLYKH